MAKTPMEYFVGNDAASSYADAYSKAESMIIVIAESSNHSYCIPLPIPKKAITSTQKYFLNGYYVNSNFQYNLSVYISTSSITPKLYYNGSEDSGATYSYYYI